MPARLPLSLATVLLVAPAASSPGQADAGMHHIFVGLNLSVRAEDKHLPVQRVTGGYIHVVENGQPRTIPYHKAVAYRMDSDVKVSTASVTLAGLAAERAYTPAADPRRKWANTQMDVYVNQALTASVAERKVIAEAIVQGMSAALPHTPRGGGSPTGNDAVQDALAEMDSTLTSIPGGDAGFYQQRMSDELREELFDAIELEFSISSAVDVPEAYFVATAEFTDPTKPEMLFHWIHAQELDEVTPIPRKVRVFKGGFPPGYKLQSTRVNIFSGRRELATNMSEKHMVLNTEDAHLYLRAQHEASNRGKNLQPRPLWTSLSPQLKAEIPASELRRVLLVEVGADGRAVSVAAEDNEYGALDTRIIDAVKSFRFYPALEKGTSAPGQLRMQFSEMTRRRAQVD